MKKLFWILVVLLAIEVIAPVLAVVITPLAWLLMAIAVVAAVLFKVGFVALLVLSLIKVAFNK